MIFKGPPDLKEIIRLIGRLKAETPEYPADMFAARKALFLKQVIAIRIQGGGKGGTGGNQGGGGGTGSAPGGSITAQGILLKAFIGLGLVAAILAGPALFRNQMAGLLDDNTVAAAQESPEPMVSPLPGALATPEVKIRPTEATPIVATPEAPETLAVSTPIVVDDIIDGRTINNDPSKGTKSNPGLHLGQTPGAPAAPGHGNPGNIHKPDKPDKPDNPDKPDKSGSSK